MSSRERELIRAIPEQDTISAMLGGVKISLPGLQRAQTAAKRNKKAGGRRWLSTQAFCSVKYVSSSKRVLKLRILEDIYEIWCFVVSISNTEGITVMSHDVKGSAAKDNGIRFGDPLDCRWIRTWPPLAKSFPPPHFKLYRDLNNKIGVPCIIYNQMFEILN